MDNQIFNINNKAVLLNFLEPLRNESRAARTGDMTGNSADNLIYENVVYRNFFTALHTSNFVIVFDYNDWLSNNPVDLDSQEFLDNADLETLQKLVTAHVRINRFSEGHLEKLMQEGYFVRVLERLEAL